MSLVICSNKLESSNPYDRFGQDQSAGSFRNHLVNTLELPANAEVAVQSVKVNKDGLIRITSSDVWYQFFNQNMRTNVDNPLINVSTLSTGMPIMCTPDMIDKKGSEFVNVEEFVKRITTGMLLGWPHPDCNRATTKCEVLRLGATILGGGFEGFRMTYDYLRAASTNLLTLEYNSLARAKGLVEQITYVADGLTTKFTCTGTADDAHNNNVVWANEYPLSHNGGIMEFQLDLLKETGTEKLNGGWSIGLQRGTNSTRGQIKYGSQNGALKYGHHYDFVVCSEQLVPGGNFFMRCAHNVYTGDDPNRPLNMEEILYYDDVEGNFTGSEWTPPFVTTKGRYNFSTNIQHFDRLRFTVNNEIVVMELMSTTGTGLSAVAGQYYVISSALLRATKSAGKESVPKPAGQTCWNLYPKVMIRTNGRSCAMSSYYGRATGYTASQEDGDWYCRMAKNGQIRLAMEIDCRGFNDLTDPTYYVQKGVTAGVFDAYEAITILTPDKTYYLGTEGANIQHRLGYIARGILDYSQGTVADQKVIYDSDVTPEIIDYSSQFIRLDNFTQTSYNAGTGRPSRILYHMPRFDNSNREIGTGLYFEPHQRVYIKLNNTEKIPANEFHLSICDNKERLITDLTGQTIICLHVREEKSMD